MLFCLKNYRLIARRPSSQISFAEYKVGGSRLYCCINQNQPWHARTKIHTHLKSKPIASTSFSHIVRLDANITVAYCAILSSVEISLSRRKRVDTDTWRTGRQRVQEIIMHGQRHPHQLYAPAILRGSGSNRARVQARLVLHQIERRIKPHQGTDISYLRARTEKGHPAMQRNKLRIYVFLQWKATAGWLAGTGRNRPLKEETSHG